MQSYNFFSKYAKKFSYFTIFLYLCTKINTINDMNQLILIAEEGERELIAKHLPHYQNVPVLVTGVGGINIIRSLACVSRDTHVINIGYAGSADYAIGSVYTVTESRLNHPNVTYPEAELHLQPIEGFPTTVGYTNTDFVLASDYHGCVFGMELAFIAAQGFARCSAIKIVSDNLSLHAYHELTHGVE